MIKVRATQRGFYGRLYNPGETFEIPDDKFSASWMEPVEKPNKPGGARRASQSSSGGNKKAASKPSEPDGSGDSSGASDSSDS